MTIELADLPHELPSEADLILATDILHLAQPSRKVAVNLKTGVGEFGPESGLKSDHHVESPVGARRPDHAQRFLARPPSNVLCRERLLGIHGKPTEVDPVRDHQHLAFVVDLWVVGAKTVRGKLRKADHLVEIERKVMLPVGPYVQIVHPQPGRFAMQCSLASANKRRTPRRDEQVTIPHPRGELEIIIPTPPRIQPLGIPSPRYRHTS